MTQGKFIVFEGIDGSGKSTQAEILYNKLLQENIKVHKTFEPTNKPVGTLLREYLKGNYSCDNKVLAGLFATDRLDHFLSDNNGIISLIKNGTTVICDRNYLSNFAYQGEENLDFVINLNQTVRDLLKPDVHIFIDTPVDIALDRISKNRTNVDMFENKKSLEMIRDNYKKCFKWFENDENIIIIDGNRTENEVAEEIYSKVSKI